MSGSSGGAALPLIDARGFRSGGFAGKGIVALALVAGFGFGLFLCKGSMLVTSNSQNWTQQEPAIKMSFKSMQVRPSPAIPLVKARPFWQLPRSFGTNSFFDDSRHTGSNAVDTRDLPRSFRTNALLRHSALTSSEIRDNFGVSPNQKCLRANKYASVCGNIVFLRPSTAVHATKKDSDEITINVDEVVQGLADKVNAIEDKPQAALYAGGAVAALVLGNGLVTTIDKLPLIPKLLKLLGTTYSGWFAYRYLLREDSRKELMYDINRITGGNK